MLLGFSIEKCWFAVESWNTELGLLQEQKKKKKEN